MAIPPTPLEGLLGTPLTLSYEGPPPPTERSTVGNR